MQGGQTGSGDAQWRKLADSVQEMGPKDKPGNLVGFSRCDTKFRKTLKSIVTSHLGIKEDTAKYDVYITSRESSKVLATGIDRVVSGDGGVYMEALKEMLTAEVTSRNVSVKVHSYFNMHYIDGVGIYLQKRRVHDRKNPPRSCQVRGGDTNRKEGYADYLVDRWYFDPDQTVVSVKGVVYTPFNSKLGRYHLMQELFTASMKMTENGGVGKV